MKSTSIGQLKKGDIVQYYGGSFEVTGEPRESQSHRPQSAHLTMSEAAAFYAKKEAVAA